MAPWQTEELRIRQAYQRRAQPGRYSWFDRAHLLASQEIERAVLAALARHGRSSLQSLALLEIGCGRGVWLREFVKWGAAPDNVHGIDLLAERIDDARRLCPNGVTLHCGNAAHLPYPDASFDLIWQSMLFTSVLDAGLRQAIAAEMLRALRPDGMILWYDYHVNNPRNHDVRGVPRREIHELFPDCEIELQRLTVAAPLARWLAPRARIVLAIARAVPWLTTHYLAVIQPRSAAAARMNGRGA
jgi:ubiquinone/menaquinone biosynthesis C-methylase UbiE